MKIATIVAIYKNSGNFDDSTNFIPITLLPIIGKIFQKCIYFRLYKYLEKYDLISSKQYGFRRKKNTQEVISLLLSKIKEQKIVVILDLKKAFDTVDFTIS